MSGFPLEIKLGGISCLTPEPPNLYHWSHLIQRSTMDQWQIWNQVFRARARRVRQSLSLTTVEKPSFGQWKSNLDTCENFSFLLIIIVWRKFDCGGLIFFQLLYKFKVHKKFGRIFMYLDIDYILTRQFHSITNWQNYCKKISEKHITTGCWKFCQRLLENCIN